MIFPSTLLILAAFFPILLAICLAIRSLRSIILQLAPHAALPALLIAIFTDQTISLHLPWVLLGIELRLEPGSCRLFLLFTALLWWLSGMFARSYLPGSNRTVHFFCYFLLAMAGNLGLILAYDSMSFYLFFALMSFSSYGLVVHDRTSQALYAGRVYIILVVIGEVALFSALLLAAVSTGSTSFDVIRPELAQIDSRTPIILLALIGFGIKAGIIGLHIWLPLAHPVAPTPASAVLSGAMIKAGLIGWLRLLPLGEIAMYQWGEVFIILGIIATFYGVVVGLSQNVPKSLLAYSSISQMGIMTISLGIGLIIPGDHPEVLSLITLFALHHGLNKGALFLGVGVITPSNGLLRKWIWLTLCLPGLALAGAPFTSGMAAKILLKQQTTSLPGHWDFLLQTLLPLSSVATTLLVGRFLFLLYRQDQPLNTTQTSTQLILPWALLVFSSMVVPWVILPVTADIWSLAAFVGSIWPVLLGIVILSGAVLWSNYHNRRAEKLSHMDKRLYPPFFHHIPPGDILLPISAVIGTFMALLRQIFGVTLPDWRDGQLLYLKKVRTSSNFEVIIKNIEIIISNWRISMIILVILGMLIATLSALQW